MILHQVLWFEYRPLLDNGERSSSALKAINAQEAFAKISLTSCYFVMWMVIFFDMRHLSFDWFLKLFINVMVSVYEWVISVKPEFCLVVKFHPEVEMKVSEVWEIEISLFSSFLLYFCFGDRSRSGENIWKCLFLQDFQFHFSGLRDSDKL